ncbi:3,4-dihydroxy-2-butanone-4-phosphate synthase [Pseudomonas putida]|uniref:3,4-dihydroxy-2-butanone 4-phosphate synthase n=1 Tax=Pseudomonas putida TaxID=303 RepID=A0A8I1JKG4_PSEPU|nr:3,4-dihydroxy-2-butanone-4-phosphate synthase [Pseudomonas putida]MBI6885023.1 3,4-dihydroxy-2-butanone-4-phosphate synthase [Pseudomonas putida]
MQLASIPQALAVIAQGGMVIVVDDEDRENEGDIVMAAQFATPEHVNFMVSECRGLVCAPLSCQYAERFDLPMMVRNNTESMGTAFTVSVDYIPGTTTGISASDRALTLQALASFETQPAQFARPGHIFPLIARPGGVLERPGHTEAAVDLAILAGLAPAGVICEILQKDGSMARRPDLELFADTHGLLIISIADLVAWRHRYKRVSQQQQSLVA